MKNVALHNLGCKVNSYEIEVMQENLEKNGYKIVPFAPGADVYIINTCTVTNIADRKSRQMLHKAKKMNPDAIVVAVGCYVQTGTENVKQDECIDLAVGNNRKKDIVSILEEFLKEKEADRADKTLHETTIPDINDGKQEYEEMTLTRAGEHTRAYIKIQDGCNQFCSYCIIPYARGRVRSRKEEDILKEVKGLVEAGYKEVVVTGIHLSSYGLDFINKDSGDYLQGVDIRTQAYNKGYLLDILEKINKIEGLERIRIGSLEPRIITKEFALRLKALNKLCPHFHLSLQSGCNETLKRMNRHYTVEEFGEKLAKLKEKLPSVSITTDVITGFPNETEEEFNKTYEWIKEMHFNQLHVFPYSPRRGTPAAKMSGQVHGNIKHERVKKLMELSHELQREFAESQIGHTLDVLIEEKQNGMMVGHASNYLKVRVDLPEESVGHIYKVKIESIDDVELIGSVTDETN